MVVFTLEFRKKAELKFSSGGSFEAASNIVIPNNQNFVISGSWKFACCCLSEFGNGNNIINKILHFENSYTWRFLLSPVASWQTSNDQVRASEPVPGHSQQIRTGPWDIFRSIRDSSVADHAWLPRDLIVGDVRSS